MIKKALGGQRLGSGAKMDVELHGYERSNHDLGYIFRSTTSAGTLVPFLNKIILPGDSFDITLNSHILTHPTIGPLFGSFKAQFDIFQAPIRLYKSELHNNKLKIGMQMQLQWLPTIGLTARKFNNPTDPDNVQINPSCILAYLGLRGLGKIPDSAEFPTYMREVQCVPLLVYWDIYKNYYANKQEEIGAVIHNAREALVETVDDIQYQEGGVDTPIPESPLSDTIVFRGPGTTLTINYTGTMPLPYQIIFNTNKGPIPYNDIITNYNNSTAGILTGAYNFSKWGVLIVNSWNYLPADQAPLLPPTVVTFPLENLDAMREYLLGQSGAVSINGADIIPYKYLTDVIPGGQGLTNLPNTQEGLAIKTYQSDLFNNWLSTEWIDGPGGISELSAVDTSGGSFTIDALTMANKVWRILNRVMASGGSYNDWIDAVYTHRGPRQIEIPMYEGGLIKELVFQEVVSNSQSETQPLGTLAGRGTLGNKHKGGTVIVKCDEPSILMGIFSLTPRLDYSQGNDWMYNLKSIDDLHKPEMDQIGFQELIQEQMAWWTTTINDSTPVTITQVSAGKQPAWINYMTSVNVVLGNFAIQSNEMFMVLNRRYEYAENGVTGLASIADLTTYIDPVKFNHIFAQTSLDAQNYWVQIAVDITARRKISGKLMPNL